MGASTGGRESKDLDWARLIPGRLRSLWRLKILLSVALTLSFWILYFGLQRWVPFPVHDLTASALDRAIPFGPGWSYVYLSLNLLTPVAPWLMDSRKELRAYCTALLGIFAAGFAVFLFFPTACPRPPLSDGMDPLYRLIRSVDLNLNACPSLHGAMAVFGALCAGRVFRSVGAGVLSGASFWTWALLILYATVATKQHLVVDILAGGLLGAAGFLVFLSLARARGPAPGPIAGKGEGG